MPDLSAMELALALVAVFVGAIVQGSIGFGFALVAVPALSFIEPDAIPVTILTLALPLTLTMALRERRHIDVAGFAWILVGRVPGTAIGVWVLFVVPRASFEILIGGLVLAAVLFSVFGPVIYLRGRTRIVAGVLSGAMGTAAGVGGPPLALVYQHRPGPEMRSTLAVSFFAGLIISLVSIGVAGKIEGSDVVLALMLVPALALGLSIAGRAHRVLDGRWLRPAVLTFAAVSGLVAVVNGLLA